MAWVFGKTTNEEVGKLKDEGYEVVFLSDEKVVALLNYDLLAEDKKASKLVLDPRVWVMVYLDCDIQDVLKDVPHGEGVIAAWTFGKANLQESIALLHKGYATGVMTDETNVALWGFEATMQEKEDSEEVDDMWVTVGVECDFLTLLKTGAE